MYYEIYVDQLIILVFIINTYLLYLVKMTLEAPVSFRKILRLSMINATLSVLWMLFPKVPFFGKVILQILVFNVFLIKRLFGGNITEVWMKAYLLMHGYGLLLGGCILAVHQMSVRLKNYYVEEETLQSNGILYPEVLVIATVFLLIMKGYLSYVRARKHLLECLIPMELDFYGNIYRCMGLYDSGNSLYEPCTGRPVNVVEKSCVEKLLINVPEEKYFIIPYHSIGREQGILTAVEIPRMILYMGKERREQEKVLIALSEQYVSKKYQVIIHPYFVKERVADV